MKLFIQAFLLLLCMQSYSQNPGNVFSIPNKTIYLGCSGGCTSITASVPHIKQTDDYVVTSIPYMPFAYATPTGNELAPLYADDIFSSAIALPFPFCFFGTTYNSVVAGSNSVLSFDITNAGCDNAYTVSPPIPYAAGTQCFQFSTYYPKASIFGPYHDVDPRVMKPGKKIEWRIEGTAPNRRFIASYNNIALFSCNIWAATHQMVIYESTGVVEMYIKDKPVCSGWNEGKAILGMQNFNRNKAVAAPGKNSVPWGDGDMNEAYRFTPAAGTATFKRAELILDGNVVALADTATGDPGILNLNFPNICPAQDSNAYIMKVYYASCSNASGEVSFTDTVYVKKRLSSISVSTSNALCTGGGTITTTITGGQPPVQYSLNGGAYQASHVFDNLFAGSYTITARDAGNCTLTMQAVVGLNNNLILQTMGDTVACRDTQFPARVSSNAASFSWTPAGGLSSATAQSPVITASQKTVYTVTATLGTCSQSKAFQVDVLPLPVVDAGPSKTILEGDQVQMQASAGGGVYSWTPATGLSAASVLNPIAAPTQTTQYTLTVMNASGCIASDSVTITVIPYCVRPMDAFTPNGDGMNDLWLITSGGCLNKATVQVFNRYGAKVFEHQDYRNNWNGTYNGKPLPDGTYYYIINYELMNGSKLIRKGNLTILR